MSPHELDDTDDTFAPMRRSVTVGSSKKGEGVLLNPTVENATVKGWLSKMGHINTDFKRRYFLLHGSRLAYFESVAAATKGKAKGLITVVKISHLPHGWPDVPPEKVALAFRFDAVYFSAVSGRVDKPFVVYADSLEAKLAWMRALADAIRPADGEPHSAIEDIYQAEIAAGMAAGRAGQGTSRVGEPVFASDGAATLWALVGEGLLSARQADLVGASKGFEAVLRRCGYVNQAAGLHPLASTLASIAASIAASIFASIFASISTSPPLHLSTSPPLHPTMSPRAATRPGCTSSSIASSASSSTRRASLRCTSSASCSASRARTPTRSSTL